MSDQTVTLRINATSEKAVAATRALIKELGGLNNAAGGAGQQTARSGRAVDQLGDAASRTEKRIAALGGTVNRLKSFAGGLAAAFVSAQGIRGAASVADIYSDIVGKLSQVTKGERELATAKASTFAIAQRYYQNLDATVTLYARARGALEQYGEGHARVAALTSTINAGLLVSRAGAAESASAILQLSQALGAGALRGEEFNAVNEAAPRLMKALADSLGVPRGALKKLAEEGALTVDVLLEAWTGEQAEQIAKEAEKVPLTIARAWQLAGNELTRYLGEADQQSGASAAVAQAIASVGDNLGVLVTLATLAGTVMAGKLAQAAYASAAALVTQTAAAAASSTGFTALGVSAARLTVAQTAAAVASRGLAAALAFVQANPIMVAVTAALALGVAVWQVAKAGEAAAAEARELQEGYEAAREAYAEFAKAPSISKVSDLREADEQLKKLQAAAKDTKDELEDVTDSYMRSMARFGTASRDGLDTATRAYEKLQGQIRTLKEERAQADGAMVRELQQLAGLERVSDAGREALARLVVQKREGSITTKELGQRLAELAMQEGNVERGAYLAANGLVAAKQAAADFGNVLKGVNSDVDAAVVNLVRLQQGKYAAWMVEQGQKINAAGGVEAMTPEARAEFNQRAAQYKALLQQTEALEKAQAQARKGATAGAREAKQALREQNKAQQEALRSAQELTQAQDDARRTLEDWRAELAGPAAQALLKYSRMERDLDMQVAAGEMSWKDYAEAMDMVSQMRAKDEALMTDQQKAAKALAEAQKASAAEYERTWRGAVESVSYAFADFVTGGINSFKDFGRTLKDIARRFIADLIGQFANNAMQNTIGNWFRGITSGGFSQAGGQGGWMQMFQSMFGGQGGGQGIMGGISSWLGGLFGGGSSAAAGSMYGFGNVGNLAGVAGASSSLGGSAAAAGGGASTGAMSGLASIPVVGWIIAGMMANSALWDKGWDIANGESWAGKIATLGAVSHADKVFRKLGLDDKTASILSGSSIHAALFGRKKPEIRGQGLQGSFGFGGLDARMFADIVEKGGVFRSDKKYTRYGTVDSEIDRAFDQAARQVNSGATALAKQLGVDISQQLAAVKIDLGKVKLDKDPEKAQAQLEKLLSDMVERLAGESVKAAGFQHLLDDGFKATEMMSALGTAIQLVTGGAERLGRALNDWERSNVTKAVEWFEQLANVNGTEIAAEIERVVGTLRSYSDLMTGVETQLLTNGLNEYQKAQLDIEMGYRDQVKQANELAKSLGLTGARAEDLAKIEQLRAVNMASLQKQYEAQKDTFLEDLGLSDLSPLRDSEKLAESMQLLRDAVGAGDLQRAQQLSQQVLGFGRNLYASGADYNGLYGEVTGLLNGMSPATLEGFTESGLDNIADILEGLPDKFAQALFQQAAGINPIAPPPVSTGTPPPTPVTTTQPTTGSTDETNTLLRALLAAVQRQGLLLEMDSLNTRVNAL